MTEDRLQRVREFVETHCIPRETVAHVHDPAALDRTLAELRPLAREWGLYLPQLPVEHGGLGLGWVERAALLEEAGRSYLGPGSMNCAAPDQPNMISLLRQGSPAQRSQYLEPLAAGTVRSCFAMTEPAPGAGSDPSMLRTTATRSGDDWVIRGHKWFITGAVGATFAIVLARADEGPTQFIVPTDTPGFRLVRAIHAIDPFAIGGHGEILFEDCRVAGGAVLGEVGQGLQYAQQRLEPARLSHCMRLMGRARRALELAQAYVNERQSFGDRLADLQQVQAMVADCHIDLHASRLMTLDCAARMDAGASVKTESAMAKVFVSEALWRVADRAAQLMGALGMSEDAPVSLILRELRPFRVYDGASELHRATLGRRFLKISQGDKA
ncbi:acyl-CoA dehydrogenase family protein [Ramlibacter ginsenosidimutans]|uniref:Acyl-CoA dehydrogenase family protein n=1 Tax=Ramlibacter ginsenosidimutans TaxID=502333 RepID=A0A934U1N3_9BURK|nr:acyl-CoA dehydrogenase family protein [Ramlibacter ginsenosidimutans]MBK6009292.1 acyl-CoA dehydrogenase family protein [Ramlibacter ginsenosidimutans]